MHDCTKEGEDTRYPPSLQVVGLDGQEKTVSDSVYIRILGANIQSNLGWQMHLEGGGEKAVLPSARRQLGLLKSQGKLIPQRSRLNLARGLVLSKLCYIMPVWGGCSHHLQKKGTSAS